MRAMQPSERPSSPSSANPSARVNVLLIGGGGREHALAWKLRQSARLGELYVTDDQNPGLAGIAKSAGVAADPKNFFPLRSFCVKAGIGLVVVGPEDPLAAGIADALTEPIMPGSPIPLVFGPSKAAARLEADKSFAKEIMHGASIPTAEARTFTDAEGAKAYIESRAEPHVVKAAGLARGKGVVVPATKAEALEAVERIMVRKEFGEAGRTVVIEEKLKGREVSVLALVDGRTIFVMEPCQDHKRLSDGATGPNTGGMGAICPSPSLDEAMVARVQREVLVPTVDALRREGIDFRGVLYAGLMLTHAGPKVLEFNCRFGDPECQTLMRRLRGDLLEILLATATRKLHEVEIGWEPGSAVCVVLAAPGYPDKPRRDVPITGVEAAGRRDGVVVFHAGTRQETIAKGGRLVTAGGRVLNVTALGDTPEQAREKAYRAVADVRFEGMQHRTDIGTSVIG